MDTGTRARRSANEDQLHGLKFNGNNDFKPNPHVHQGQDHGEGDHGDEHGHGYQVFHVEFSRVEVPFIIALWIFVSSLAKIGKIFP